MHVALETAAAIIGYLATYLVLGRVREFGLLRDFALSFAFGLFASTNLAFSVLPAALAGARWDTFSIWSSLITRTLATLIYAWAAFGSDVRLRSSERAGARLVSSVTVVLVAVAAFVVAFTPRLPAGIQVVLAPEASGQPHIDGHPVVHGVQLLTMLLFGAASVGFLRRARRADELMRWLAGASALAAFSRLNYLLFPSLYSQYVYTGDVLRLGFYLFVMIGAFKEIRRSWSKVATLEERRRIARELHDGLTQELAFIAMRTRGLDQRSADQTTLMAIASAAERARDESRRAVAALTKTADEPFESLLGQMCEEVGNRTGAKIQLDLASGIRLPSGTSEELLRIAREAMNNAARHGHPRTITVHVSNEGRLRLRITDDGKGFDFPRVRAEMAGFGLVSMRERADALGAELRITSEPGKGTEVEVMLR